jgi:hypothetical protein
MSKLTRRESIEKAKSLDLAELIDFEIWSGDSNVNNAVDEIYSDLNTLPALNTNIQKRKNHIKIIILNLYNRWFVDPELFTSYQRNSNFYSGLEDRYNPNKASRLIATVVDSMKQKGYLEDHTGFYDRTHKGKSRLSRMRATDKLIPLMTKYGIKNDYIQKSPKTECIIQRNKDKKETDYVDTRAIIKIRKSLNAYNNLLRSTFIDIPDNALKEYEKSASAKGEVKINLNEKFIKRIFNNSSWDDGGRFYGGWWQRIPRELRQKVRINHDPVIEIDYSGLHIILLYANDGIDYWKDIGKDPYILAGYKDDEKTRRLLKFILLTILNAETKAKAIKAIQKEINFNQKIYFWVKRDGIDIRKIVDDFASNHERIKKHFFTGEGVKLQRLDSRIAEDIINQFAKEEIPVLCIHDSFIVQSVQEEKLKKMMEDSFIHGINEIGIANKGLIPKMHEKGFGKDAFEKYWIYVWEDPLPTFLSPYASHDNKSEMEGYFERMELHKKRKWEKDYYHY